MAKNGLNKLMTRPALLTTAVILGLLAAGCEAPPPATGLPDGPFLVVLGIAQDAGYPQAGCQKACCAEVWDHPQQRRAPACLAIVDPQSSQSWLIEATPDFKNQLRRLERLTPGDGSPIPTGIFLTHAHIGHYSGLTQLGREVIGAGGVPVYAMPRMETFLRSNGPWDQLVSLQNISLRQLHADSTIRLNERLAITPFPVPHRDEYSETVGFRIDGPQRSALFIPDIDKWEKWERPVEALIGETELAFLDGTFYAEGEIPGRNMAEIPHPFIRESMARFATLPTAEKSRIYFIHLNHTNPALHPDSDARKKIQQEGFRIAEELEIFGL